MIDRASRNKTLLVIDRFLEGKTTSFRFDEELHDIETEDLTVREIRFLTWFHYDDVIDHSVKLDCAQWKFFQRLRLALQSEIELRRVARWKWNSEHSFALVALVGLGLMAAIMGVGVALLSANIVIGLIFYTLAWVQSRREPTMLEKWQRELFPFGSFDAMRTARESAPEFRKIPYRWEMDLGPLRPRSRLILMHLGWLIATPVMLATVFLRVRYCTFEAAAVPCA